MKVNIIGSAGSGKTTLAKSLAKNKNIVLHLDNIVYRDKEKQIKNSVGEFQKILKEWVSKDEWIIEGIFPFEEVFEKADKIIVIKPPFLISLFRQWYKFITSSEQRKQYGLKNNIVLSLYIYRQYFGKNSSIPSWNLRILNYSQLFSLLKPFLGKVEVKN